VQRVIQTVDAHIRRRLRAILLRHWKTKQTTVHHLIRLGVQRRTAWRRVYAGRKSLWALSHDPAVNRGLRNAYFAERGLVTLLERFSPIWEAIAASRLLALPWDAARS
jgi:RNA-directed DNA polymerase